MGVSQDHDLNRHGSTTTSFGCDVYLMMGVFYVLVWVSLKLPLGSMCILCWVCIVHGCGRVFLFLLGVLWVFVWVYLDNHSGCPLER